MNLGIYTSVLVAYPLLMRGPKTPRQTMLATVGNRDRPRPAKVNKALLGEAFLVQDC